MATYLDVPFVSQLNYGGANGNKGNFNDPTGCWYSSACMLAYYQSSGPRLGVPALHSESHSGDNRLILQLKNALPGQPGHQRIGSAEAQLTLLVGGAKVDEVTWGGYDILCRNEGLAPAPGCEDAKQYSADELATMLTMYGPLFFGWLKPWGPSVSKYGHASVLVGAESGVNHVTYHDPEDGPDRKMTLVKFNELLQRHPYSILYKATQ